MSQSQEILSNMFSYPELNFFCCREGDITKLIADLIVHPTNESLNDKNPLSERIHKGAGPLLKDECRNNLLSKLQIY